MIKRKIQSVDLSQTTVNIHFFIIVFESKNSTPGSFNCDLTLP